AELAGLTHIAQDLDIAPGVADEDRGDERLGIDLAAGAEVGVSHDVAQIDDPEVGGELGVGEAELRQAAEVGHLPAFELVAARVAGAGAGALGAAAGGLAVAAASAATDALALLVAAGGGGNVVNHHGAVTPARCLAGGRPRRWWRRGFRQRARCAVR